jgi:hypothetical protein
MKRLNVDLKIRNCRIATQLIHRLEQALTYLAMIMFESSNLQYPTNALSRKEGFRVDSQSPPSVSGFSSGRWKNTTMVRVRRNEKFLRAVPRIAIAALIPPRRTECVRDNGKGLLARWRLARTTLLDG